MVIPSEADPVSSLSLRLALGSHHSDTNGEGLCGARRARSGGDVVSQWQPPSRGERRNAPPGMYETKAEAVVKMGCAIALAIVFLAAAVGFALLVLYVGRNLR